MNSRIAGLLLFLIPAFLFAQKRPSLIPYRKGESWGYADTTKKLIIAADYRRAFPFMNGKALAEAKDYKLRVIDTTGKILTVLPYKLHEYLGNGLLKMSLNYEKEGLIDISGKVILEAKYIFIEQYKADSFVVYLPGKKGAMNRAGKIITPFTAFDTDNMDNIMNVPVSFPPGDCEKPCLWSAFREGMGVVAHQGKFGYADTSKTIVIPCRYNHAESFLSGLGRVMFDKPGQTKEKPYTDSAGVIHTKAYAIEEGYVDRLGNEYWED